MTAISASRKPRQNQAWHLRRRAAVILIHGVLGALSLLWVIPFYWLVITSLKPLEQVFSVPLTWFPDPVQWINYIQAFTHPGFPFLRLLANSMIYAVPSTVGAALSCSIVAYAFARMEFWGRDVLFSITLASMMLPGVVQLVPTYLLFHRLGLIGSFAALIVPSYFGSAFYIFMLRQFFLTLPWELTDAAHVDGANDWRIFWQIMLPLIKPAVLAVVVFNFVGCWNDFMGPLLYLQDSTKYPLSIGLYAFQTQHETQWHLMMAATLTVTVPLITIFFLAQRQFIEGITLTGIKV